MASAPINDGTMTIAQDLQIDSGQSERGCAGPATAGVDPQLHRAAVVCDQPAIEACGWRSGRPWLWSVNDGREAIARLAEGEWPAPSVLTRLFGAWSAAGAVAAQRRRDGERTGVGVLVICQGVDLPAEPPGSTARTEVLRGGEATPVTRSRSVVGAS